MTWNINESASKGRYSVVDETVVSSGTSGLPGGGTVMRTFTIDVDRAGSTVV